MCPPRPARIMTTVSAVSARGTVEMLNAPERANVSTDMPSQAPNPSKLANDFADHRVAAYDEVVDMVVTGTERR
jgi:hypothetical protein